MPFYFFLTTFRVLSISLIIVALPYTCMVLYPLFLLGIVVLGYTKTSKEEGFLVRGLRSMVTTGKGFKSMYGIWLYTLLVDERYHAENVFQIYWLLANTILLAVGAINANLNTVETFTSLAIRSNLHVFNGALVVCFITGPLSYVLFWFQRREEIPELPEIKSQDDDNQQSEDKRLFEQVLEDIKLGKRPNVNVIVRLADVILLLFEYPVIVLQFVNSIFGTHQIWSALHLLFAFLPGVAWYSYTNLVGFKNRLYWFFSGICFPGFVAWARVSLSLQLTHFLSLRWSALTGVGTPCVHWFSGWTDQDWLGAGCQDWLLLSLCFLKASRSP